MGTSLKVNLTSPVYIPRSDGFSRTLLDPNKNIEDNKGLPQPYFIQDALPTKGGYTAVDFMQSAPSPGGANLFKEGFFLLDANNLPYYFFPQNQATQYIYAGGLWRVATIVGATSGAYSFSQVRQQSYICFPGNGLYTYNVETNALTKAVLIGIQESGIKGVANAKGYNILFTDTQLYWSSVLNPLDFVPSLSTGAGTNQIQDIRGRITTVLPIKDGFITYSERNAISATFSGNLAFPWVFKEIEGSNSVSASTQVSYEANLLNHIIWSEDSGFMQLSKTSAEPAWPEITDYIRSKLVETLVLTPPRLVTAVAPSAAVKVVALSSRYVCLSHQEVVAGTGEFAQVIIYDLGLQRWGKIAKTHVDVLRYSTTLSTTALALESPLFSLLSKTGEISSYFQIEWQTQRTLASTPAILIGKFTSSSSYTTDILGVEVESSLPSTEVWLLTSLDGKTIAEVTKLQALADTNLKEVRNYPCYQSGKWHSLLITGGFSLTAVITDMIFSQASP